MLHKFSLLTLGATLGFAAMAFTSSGASAAMLPLAPQASSQTNGTSGNVVEVAQKMGDRRMRSQWNSRRDGNRCSRRSGNCSHYHNGFYYQTPWWSLPLIIGGSIAAQNNDGGGYGNRHVEWCSDHYRSYNPRNNTWVAYSGQVNQCVSPY